MRLIDADKLKEYVNSKSTHPLCEWDTAGVLMAIDEQETVEQKWIPCSERLPDESGEYLVTILYDGKIMLDIDDIDCDGRVKKWNYRDSVKVLAWMPLPQPYRA